MSKVVPLFDNVKIYKKKKMHYLPEATYSVYILSTFS